MKFLLKRDFRKNGVSFRILFAFEWLYFKLNIHRYLLIYNINTRWGLAKKLNYNPDSQFVLIYTTLSLVLILTADPQTMSSWQSVLYIVYVCYVPTSRLQYLDFCLYSIYNIDILYTYIYLQTTVFTKRILLSNFHQMK